jgi:hypothetical protein
MFIVDSGGLCGLILYCNFIQSYLTTFFMAMILLMIYFTI